METDTILSTLNELTNRIIILNRKIDAIAEAISNL